MYFSLSFFYAHLLFQMMYYFPIFFHWSANPEATPIGINSLGLPFGTIFLNSRIPRSSIITADITEDLSRQPQPQALYAYLCSSYALSPDYLSRSHSLVAYDLIWQKSLHTLAFGLDPRCSLQKPILAALILNKNPFHLLCPVTPSTHDAQKYFWSIVLPFERITYEKIPFISRRSSINPPLVNYMHYPLWIWLSPSR